MNRHATLNRFYRLVWSDNLAAYVAVAETATGRGKRTVRAGALAAAFIGILHALPRAGRCRSLLSASWSLPSITPSALHRRWENLAREPAPVVSRR